MSPSHSYSVTASFIQSQSRLRRRFHRFADDTIIIIIIDSVKMTVAAKTKHIREPLPWLVDEIAKTDPARVWHSVPKNANDLSQGYRDIAFAEGARAINRYCAFIEQHIGRNESTSDSVVCWVGLQDPRCHYITLALQKLGHVVLMSAPRNSLPMHLNLFNQTNCHTLFHGSYSVMRSSIPQQLLTHST